MNRRPKGYVGLNHLTRGGDILAILQCIHLPEQTLGPERANRLKSVRMEDWYPIAELLELLETLEEKLGSYHLRQVGWTICQRFHAAEVKQRFRNAKELLQAFDAMYHMGNKGTGIGGWSLLSFEPGRALLEKTTPHHCQMEEGIVEESLRTIGVPVKIRQTQCFRKGAPCCHYLLESHVTDGRWGPPA